MGKALNCYETNNVQKGQATMSVRVEIGNSINNGSIDTSCDIYITGMGSCAEEFGAIAYIEFYEGKYTLRVWADINQEDCTHSIDLCNAYESKRRNGLARLEAYSADPI